MRIRRAVAALALTATVAGGTAVLPTAAEAGTTTSLPSGASAYSTGLYVAPGSGINANLAVTGAVGALIGPLVNPILSTVTNTLVSALVGDGTANNPGLLSQLVSALSAFTTSSATTPSYVGGSNSYNQTAWLGTGVLAPLVNVTSQAVAGNTTSDASTGALSASATIASPVISLFGLPIAQLGTMTAKSTCPTSGSAVALNTSASLGSGSVSLLGGLLSFSVAANGLLMVQVGSSAAVPISQLQTQLLALAGLNVQVTPTGTNALRISIQLGLANLLTSFGLGAIAGLTGLTGNTMALTATIAPGPSTVSTSGGSAQASGLEIKLGLSGTLGLNVLGLVGAGITVAPISGNADGDLLDLQLAYTSCTSGTTSGGGGGSTTGGTTGGSGGSTTGGSTGGTWYPAGLI